MDNCIILIFYKKAKLLQAQRVYWQLEYVVLLVIMSTFT
jgi:hypothetical protein